MVEWFKRDSDVFDAEKEDSSLLKEILWSKYARENMKKALRYWYMTHASHG